MFNSVVVIWIKLNEMFHAAGVVGRFDHSGDLHSIGRDLDRGVAGSECAPTAADKGRPK